MDRKALREVQQESGGLCVGLGGVGRPTQRFGGVGMPSEGPAWVERPSRRYGRGREDLPEIWEALGGPPNCPLGVEWPLQRSRGVGRPSWWSGRGWESLMDV